MITFFPFKQYHHSGFNSALAVQVNTTRQDVRIAKEKLREEERQNKEAQQSLEDWSREVESERQLLFEAMAYLNEDVRSPSPDIQKIQSDIKRLKDFIAYKVLYYIF
jgi:predicted  nucleic acid-binding Zn-ribbon protein